MLPLKKYIQHPATLLVSLLKAYGTFIPDKLYIQLLFRLKMGYWPNLKHPTTFNEKQQWLKLYDRRPEYTQMVDKVEAKKYVASIIGEEYIIPTLGVWDSPEDIDWNCLPQQFVLKTTHGSGGSDIIICKDKNTLDKEEAIRKLKRSMKKDVYKTLREWPYKNVKKRVLAEKYMTDGSKGLLDYKFFCFNGIVKLFKIDFDRFTNHYAYYFDREGILLPFSEKRLAPEAEAEIIMPKALPKMIALAEDIARGHIFLRVDFYISCDKIYFGETTFYPASGFGKFEPERWDLILGDSLQIKN